MLFSLKQFDYDWERRDRKIRRDYAFIVRYYNRLSRKWELEDEEKQAWQRYEEERTITWKQEELDELGYTLRTTIEAQIKIRIKKIKKIKIPIVKTLCANCGEEILKWQRNKKYCDGTCRKEAYDRRWNR